MAATDCGINFYNPFEGGAEKGDCLECLAGFRCNDVATWDWEQTTNSDMPQSAIGKYSETGSTVETPCPEGSWCAVGSATPTECKVGFYNDDPEA